MIKYPHTKKNAQQIFYPVYPVLKKPDKYTHMKHQILAWILALLFVFSIHTVTVAGHSTDNGTCTDDIIHWQNMIEKRSDAPLYEQSKIVQAQAVGKRVVGKHAECETLMEEALRMIRKTDGEYPTE